MATPKQIRAELKRLGTPFTVVKREGCWYVDGDGTDCWRSTSLNTYRFDRATVDFWVDIILDMAKTKGEEA